MSPQRRLLSLLSLQITLSFSPTTAQQIGTTPEVHPKLPTQRCTTAGGCTTQQTSLVIDALSRPFHATGNPSLSCANATTLQASNATLCPDAATCAQNCVLEGIADYNTTLGVLASGDGSVTLRQYVPDGGVLRSVSPRVYLLGEDGQNYEGLTLLGQELAFDVDLSQLGCGMNGALYLSEMALDGGRENGVNPAGAAYGTGYCDAQCFATGWINGLPNLNNSGACCNEMDIWEANSQANAFTPHTCSSPGPFLCTGDECQRTPSAVCDKNGCGLNTYGLGALTFYGPGLTVDTSRPFTVVTQFLTGNTTTSTTTPALTEIRRLYIQDSHLIPSTPQTNFTSLKSLPGGYNGAITQPYCTARTGSTSDFLRLGGLQGMGAALARGMVLVLSIWSSPLDFMSWLDAGANGPCNATQGDPAQIERDEPGVAVTFSNVRWGEIGSTFNVSGLSGSGSGVGKNGNASAGVVGGKGVTAGGVMSGAERVVKRASGAAVGTAVAVGLAMVVFA